MARKVQPRPLFFVERQRLTQLAEQLTKAADVLEEIRHQREGRLCTKCAGAVDAIVNPRNPTVEEVRPSAARRAWNLVSMADARERRRQRDARPGRRSN